MGPTHYALGASFGLAYVGHFHLDAIQAAIAIPLAAVFAHGAISPDIDNTRWWQRIDRWVPDEQLGNQGPMRHRGIAHWWGTLLLLSFALATIEALTGIWWWWIPGAILTAWWSHIVGDFAVGARSKHRGPGVPLMPWWCHVGLGFHCEGWVERQLLRVIPLAMIWQAACQIHLAPAPWTLVA